jgi:tRNA dimethylallyltransferase
VRVLVLLGPTAAGKTAVACALADRRPCHLISMDSTMVYRGLDIGTAKPDAEERTRYPHALIDLRDPEQTFSAADFVVAADREVRSAWAADRLPVLVGGSMLYARAFRAGLAALPPADPVLRAEITSEAAERGWAALHEELERIDPEAARGIHPNNPQRLQRALEVYRATGRPLSAWWHDQRDRGAAVRLGADLVEVAIGGPARAHLHERIERRFDAMLEAGFEAEVARLRLRPGLGPETVSMRAVGYRQMWAYLDGAIDHATMRNRALAATRQLAKKQLTWLKDWPWVHVMAEAPAAEAATGLDERLRAPPA